MTFSSLTVLILFFTYVFRHIQFNGFQQELRQKYHAETWHYGYFADRKLYKMLEPQDKFEWDLRSKKLSRFTLFFLLYSVFIFMISGVFFNGKL